MAAFAAALRTIETYAAGLSLPARPARDGSVSFLFERSGRLTFTPSEPAGQVIVSLARRPARADAALERRAFEAAGLDPTTSRFLHAGLAPDGSLIFALDVAEPEFDLPTLEACFRRLAAAHDAVA